jgi:hypothetical protein
MWRLYAVLIELVSFLYGLRLLVTARDRHHWASARSVFALETAEKTGAIQWFRTR